MHLAERQMAAWYCCLVECTEYVAKNVRATHRYNSKITNVWQPQVTSMAVRWCMAVDVSVSRGTRKWQHCNITLGDMYLTGYLLPRYVYAAWSSFSEIY